MWRDTYFLHRLSHPSDQVGGHIIVLAVGTESNEAICDESEGSYEEGNNPEQQYLSQSDQVWSVKMNHDKYASN